MKSIRFVFTLSYLNRFMVLKKDQRVIFQLDEKLKIGRVTLHVVFSGFLNDYLQGFYRSKYTVDGVEKYMATTQFESTDARMAFPCWDEPAVKARFRISLTTPLNYTAVSNMPVIKKTILEDHGVKKVVSFMMIYGRKVISSCLNLLKRRLCLHIWLPLWLVSLI